MDSIGGKGIQKGNVEQETYQIRLQKDENESQSDIKNVYVIYEFVNGKKYEGSWKNDLMHGKGIFLWQNVKNYVGEFKNGRKSCFGMEFECVDRYIGEWNNAVLNGKGKYEVSSIDYHGLREGKGVKIFSDGGKYDGELTNQLNETKQNPFGKVVKKKNGLLLAINFCFEEIFVVVRF